MTTIISIAITLLIVFVAFYIAYKISQNMQRNFDAYLLQFTRNKEKKYTFYRKKGIALIDISFWFIILGIIITFLAIELKDAHSILFAMLIVVSIAIIFRFSFWKNSHMVIDTKKSTLTYINFMKRPSKKTVNLHNVKKVHLNYLHMVILFDNNKSLALPIAYYSNLSQLYAVLKSYE